MFVFYAFLTALLLSVIGIFYIKNFQLENYKIKNYLIKVAKFQYSFTDKNFLIWTNRIKRLFFCDFFVNFLIFLIVFYYLCNYFSLFVLLPFVILRQFEIIISFVICYPIELLIKSFYLKKAKKKLSKTKCKKIAITGSFGKTSTKNILKEILQSKFDVCATPKSYNTPMGVCKTILNDLKDTDDFFVVEFGARRKGDIEFLANFVGVDFGIITPIGKCHIESFKSVENIENTKYELCQESKNFVVFNGKSVSSKKLFERFSRQKYLTCQKGGLAYAKNISSSNSGSRFELVLDEKSYFCHTKLLGKANIDNIVTASAMAYLVGVDPTDIVDAIRKLSATPHRLELITGQVATVIDDSYNSNYDGFSQALDVLKSFGGRKIVVSPGMVELGKNQYQQNFEIAKKVASVADVFVIMNKTNKTALTDGAKNGGAQILYANSRKEQKELLKNILKKGDVVLFENDLPDNFK